MRGRKPTPVRLRVVRGNPGRRPLPVGGSLALAAEREAGAALAELPPPPDHLGDVARQHWWDTGEDLMERGLLTQLDLGALAGLCVAYARWVDAEEKLARTNIIVKTPNGMVVQSPLLAISNRAWEQMMKIYAEFGMTPSARARVAVARKGGKANPLEKYIRGRPGIGAGGGGGGGGGR